MLFRIYEILFWGHYNHTLLGKLNFGMCTFFKHKHCCGDKYINRCVGDMIKIIAVFIVSLKFVTFLLRTAALVSVEFAQSVYNYNSYIHMFILLYASIESFFRVFFFFAISLLYLLNSCCKMQNSGFVLQNKKKTE